MTDCGVSYGIADVKTFDVLSNGKHPAGSTVTDLVPHDHFLPDPVDRLSPVAKTVCLMTCLIQGSEKVCLASSMGVFESVLSSVPELISE